MGLDFCLISFSFVAASHSAFLKVGGSSGPTVSRRDIVSQKNLSMYMYVNKSAQYCSDIMCS